MRLKDEEIQLYLDQGWYPPIQTNIHVKDRPEWGMWECVREVVQNALDETESYDVKRMGLSIEQAHLDIGGTRYELWKGDIPSLIVDDDGQGMFVTNLLLGGGDKPSWVRGRFGEGLKYACLVALREGYDMDIFTVETQIRPFIHLRAIPEPRLGTVQEVPILGFLYRKYPDWEKGTSVRIIGYEGTDYPERFAQNRRWTWKKLGTPEGAPSDVVRAVGICDDPEETVKTIYVRDIYVMDWPGLFSYNVWDVTLTRERNTPQADSELYKQLGKLWVACDNKGLIWILLNALNKVDQGIREVDEIWCERPIEPQEAAIWREIWVELYGEKSCIWSDDRAAKRAEWDGYKVIRIGPGWRYTLQASGVVAYDADVVKLQLLKRVVPDEELEKSPRDFAILELMRDLGTVILELHYPALPIPKFVVAEVAELDTTGAYLPEGEEAGVIKVPEPVVALGLQIISDVEQTLRTFIHEMAHHTSHGAADLTKPHLVQIRNVGAYVVSLMVSSEYYRDIFRDLRRAQLSHTRESEEWEILERVKKAKETREAEREATKARGRLLSSMTREEREDIRAWEALVSRGLRDKEELIQYLREIRGVRTSPEDEALMEYVDFSKGTGEQ